MAQTAESKGTCLKHIRQQLQLPAACYRALANDSVIYIRDPTLGLEHKKSPLPFFPPKLLFIITYLITLKYNVFV